MPVGAYGTADDTKSDAAQIWYLYHSGFAVKTNSHFLVFDYYRDSPSEEGPHITAEALISQEAYDREIVVFASHGHGDHFNQAIFAWKNRDTNIHYVLSHDIRAGRGQKGVTVVYPGHKYQVGTVEVETFDSTDIGVAFLVRCDGLTIFHAGDLNWWHWNGEPDEDNTAMAKNYKQQVDLLQGKQIDLGFIPVDPRLEEHYSRGLVYFMQVVGAEVVFPMHFGGDYSVFERLKKDLPPDELKHIVELTPLCRQFTYRAGQ